MKNDEDDFNFDLDSDHGGIYRDIKLKDVFAEMPTGMKLIYHFDFGDDWMFEITKMQSEAKNPDSKVKYPRVAKSNGRNPVQYPSFED